MNRAAVLLATPVLMMSWACLSSAQADPWGSLNTGTQLIIVEPTEDVLTVQAALNKGNRNPRYRVGEPIEIQVRVSEDAYIYLFSVEADGQSQVILPNRYGRAPLLQAHQTQTYPIPGSGFQFTVSAPYGQSRVVVVAAKTRLSLQDLVALNRSFNTTQTQSSASPHSSSLAIEVEPTQQAWVSRSLYYRVGS